ncbi:SDR family oxidoreductase [Nonomuraea sp. PA05]|uniref:SDR family oxidoreductase n=1 Tax=Nonomuraea sp. PA05 TaxID=2604466 RepID=UPI0011D79971|nr:SDR family oxidoreductase [Nonomuraea sp. PA05]TYB54745.1 SDR family oxidoreductase [Nonomuraea sp. PA05]
MAATVAVVTGAARGVGRGIALVLGETGATVYVTDRESRDRHHPTLPGTVEGTAEQVSERGGTGVPVRVDHADDRAVEALFARVREERGGLDLLVANAFAGNALPFRGGPFWTLPLDHWHNMIDVGLRSHLVSAWYAAPLLIERGGGLIVLTGYTDPDAEVIAGHLFYDLAMTGVSRLARSLAHDLHPHRVTALAVSPGFTRTEAILAELGEGFTEGDPVEFPGRAVRALLEDPDVGRFAGRTLPVADLAEEYGLPR